MGDVYYNDARLQFLIATLPQRLETVVETAGLHVEQNAKRIIIEKDIIDTGATLNSTESRLVPGDRWARRIGPTTHYALTLELGTRRMAARPFMVPALEMERVPFHQAIGAVFRV